MKAFVGVSGHKSYSFKLILYLESSCAKGNLISRKLV